MADLIDRLVYPEDVTGRPPIPTHEFAGRLRLYTGGKRTRAQAIVGFDLQGDELTQANQIADAIDARTGAAAKAEYLNVLLGVLYALEGDTDPLIWPGGALSKAQVGTDLELT